MAKKDSVKNLSLRDQYNLSLKNLRSSAEFQSSSKEDQYAIMNDLKERYEQAKAAEEEQKKQISLAQAAQNAEALQAMEEQKKQQKQQLAGKRLEQLQSIPSDVRGLEAMRRSDSAYLSRGGTFGDIFTGRRQPTAMELESGQYRKGEKVATLGSGFYDPAQGLTGLAGRSPAPNAKAINVIPSALGLKQNYATMRNSGPYAIAPELFRRGGGTSGLDSSNQFYSTVTGQAMPSLMGRGAYGGFGKDAVDEQGRPISKYSPQIMERRAGRGKNPYGAESTGKIKYSGQVNNNSGAAMAASQVPSSSMGMTGSSPLAFTGFGFKTGFGPSPTSTIEPPANSPFSGRLGYGASYGMLSQFPYAGY